MLFEYKMLAFMTFIFLLAWMPSSIAKWKSFGPKWLMSNRNPVTGKELRPWGARAERAHQNLKDNFPGFVVAILLLGITNHFDSLTAWAAGLYVFGRLGHFLFYVLGHVPLRAIFFMLALSCNLFLLLKVAL